MAAQVDPPGASLPAPPGPPLALPPPQDFQRSYALFEQYPLNLLPYSELLAERHNVDSLRLTRRQLDLRQRSPQPLVLTDGAWSPQVPSALDLKVFTVIDIAEDGPTTHVSMKHDQELSRFLSGQRFPQPVVLLQGTTSTPGVLLSVPPPVVPSQGINLNQGVPQPVPSPTIPPLSNPGVPPSVPPPAVPPQGTTSTLGVPPSTPSTATALQGAGQIRALLPTRDTSYTILPGALPNGSMPSCPDPPCRFYLLPAKNAISPLEMSRSMLLRLLSYHQVTPKLLEFLFVYGAEYTQDRVIRFSGFRTEINVDPSPISILPALKRSGQHYQVCYNFKAVGVMTKEHHTGLWIIRYRQGTVMHQFDLEYGTQHWIVGDPRSVLSKRLCEMFKAGEDHAGMFANPQTAFRTSLSIHLAFAHAATRDWRLLIQRVEENVSSKTDKFLSFTTRKHTVEDLSNVQQLERHHNTALAVLESNEAIIADLLKFITQQAPPLLRSSKGFPPHAVKDCARSIERFEFQLQELSSGVAMQLKHLRLLVQVLADRKAVLVQRLESQRMEADKSFNTRMWLMARRSQAEAVIMRIINLIALIFLPATFISTFFSTGIVTYKEDNSATTAGVANSSLTPQPQPSRQEDTASAGSARGVHTNWVMLSEWGKYTGITTGATVCIVTVLLLIERRNNWKRTRKLKDAMPDAYER